VGRHVPRSTLIINFKNYREILGDRSIELAREAERIAQNTGLEIIVSPPLPMISSVVKAVSIPVFSQRVDEGEEGRSTGAIIPESVSGAGCRGSILNHSECRVNLEVISRLLPRMRSLKLEACVCAKTAEEVAEIAVLAPEYLAIEPPKLIGTGISVSKARPELVAASIDKARSAGFGGKILCGAGIVTASDASAARRLGVQGVLVASSIVRAQSWRQKIQELSEALSD
jgi:triosephosphate isomerase